MKPWPKRHSTTQHPESVQEAVEKALQSAHEPIRLEGECARAAGAKLVGFKKPIGVKQSIGEVDVETTRAVIEVTVRDEGKMKQLRKMVQDFPLSALI